MPLTELLAALTPGASLSIWRKSRPFMGRSLTVRVSTTPVEGGGGEFEGDGLGIDFDERGLAGDAQGEGEVVAGDDDFDVVHLFGFEAGVGDGDCVFAGGELDGMEKSPVALARTARVRPVAGLSSFTAAFGRAGGGLGRYRRCCRGTSVRRGLA